MNHILTSSVSDQLRCLIERLGVPVSSIGRDIHHLNVVSAVQHRVVLTLLLQILTALQLSFLCSMIPDAQSLGILKLLVILTMTVVDACNPVLSFGWRYFFH